MKILVAIDRSTVSELVIQRSLSIAQPAQAQVVLLTVVEYPNAPFTSIMLPTGDLVGMQNIPDLGLEARLKEAGQSLLDHHAAKFATAGVECQTRLELGGPRETICQVAKEVGADFLVIGSRGLGTVERLMLGSVSDYIIHHAPCAVLVVR
jgi:nucleotide-binding universal stress UspA family protein